MTMMMIRFLGSFCISVNKVTRFHGDTCLVFAHTYCLTLRVVLYRQDGHVA